MEKALLTQEEMALSRHCLAFALEAGADKARITLTKSLMNLTGLLNGEVDKVALALDRSLQLQLFVDGRFGTFSSNRLEQKELEAFIRESIDTVRMLEADACRQLPSPDRLVKNSRTGLELGLGSGILVTNPIPEEYSMDPAVINAAIDEAVAQANALGIHGKETTPFLLAKVKELTGGDSLESNIRLVFNNAALAARTAACLAN